MPLNLDHAVLGHRGSGSTRVLRDQSGQEASISEWATQLAAKFDRKPEAVQMSINNAVRSGRPVYGLTLTLVSGRAYVKGKPRGPRQTKTNGAQPVAMEQISAQA